MLNREMSTCHLDKSLLEYYSIDILSTRKMCMPKTNSAKKPVRSFRLSHEGIQQLTSMATLMGRSESDVIEVALDRMYREEIRFNRVLREGNRVEDQYHVDSGEEDKNESDRNVV